MKKHIVLTALTLAAATISAAEVKDGFETRWGTWGPKASKAVFKFNKTEGNTAPGCGEITFKPGHPAGQYGCFTKRFPAEGGKTYRVTVMVRNKNPEKPGMASVTAQSYQGKKYLYQSMSSTKIAVGAEWIRIGAEFTQPKNADTAYILLSGFGEEGSVIQFDDLELTEVDLSKNFKDNFDTYGWTFWKANDTKVSPKYDRTEGHEAKGCASLVVEAGNPNGKSGSLMRRIPVQPGKEYTLVVFVKNSGLSDKSSIGLNLQGLNEKGNFLGTGVQGTKIKAEDCRDWKRMVFTYKIPATGKWQNCAKILVTLTAGGTEPGTAWFDDFEFFCNDEE